MSLLSLSIAGQPIGQSLKTDVHGIQTPLHLAFSVHVFDDLDRILRQRGQRQSCQPATTSSIAR
jgi:isopentenyl-diphosphate Delta-isomerase